MLLDVTTDAGAAVLGAMRAVATAGGTNDLSDAAAGAIASLASTGLGLADATTSPATPSVAPKDLAAALGDPGDATTAIEILGIMALVDGTLDTGRIDQVLDFASACGIADNWLEDLRRSLDDLEPVIADMGDRNLRSITDGKLDLAHVGDIDQWLRPYQEGGHPELAARYRELASLPAGSLGHEFWAFYDRHHFDFPGQPEAANEVFTTPHDTTHLLSGYDTTPQGELLVSTFTARMHPIFPMEGHILPVIYSWHLGIELNQLAGSYRGALEPAKFWVAWDRGRRTDGDAFGLDFDFWEHIQTPLADLQAAFGVPPLDPRHAAHSDAVAGVDYTPIP